MIIQVQIPVTRFAVAYEVGLRRPYSTFEHLLLAAIDRGASDLETLSSMFAVPGRLVVEGVVTLVHAGWIGLGSDDNSLLTTLAGHAAAESREPPTTLETRQPFPLHVAMERVAGSYCRNSDVTLIRDQDLQLPDGTSVIRLDPQMHDNHIDTGDVRPLLRVDPGQWVRWISPDARLVSKGSQSAIGLFDPESGRLTNLPDSFRAAIEPVLVARFGGRADRYVPPQDLPPDTRRCRIEMTEGDLIVNADEHQALIRRALIEATNHFVACSAFLRRSVLEALASDISDALERGVSVDLLWGYDDASRDTPEALEYVKKLQYDNRSAAGELTCNQTASGSHAKILIWDSAARPTNATVGSYNWLSAGSTPLGELSVRVTHPGLVADLARFVADRWSEIPGARLESAQRRWHQLSSEWEQLWSEEDEPEPGVIASVVLGRTHEAALRRALVDSSPGVVAVLSHRIAPVGIRRLRDGASIERSEFTGAIVAGELIDETTQEQVQETADSLRMRYLNRPVHAKVLVHRDSVIVGSYNYLSADSLSRGGRSRELSLRFDGLTARKLVQARLPEIWSAST
jgi:hypothetical protein